MGNTEITNAELLNVLVQKIDDKFNYLSKSIEDSTANINKKLIIATKTILNLKRDNQDLRDRVINLENKIRRNNIAVFGLKPDKSNLLESSISKLNNILKVQVLSKSDVSNIYWPQNKSTTPVIIELITNFKKIEVFEKIKENLVSLKDAQVFITNDLSYEERQIRKCLKEKQTELKKDNKNAKITGRALIVDGQKIHYKELLQTDVDYSESDLESVSEYETELTGKEIANENDTTDLKKRKIIHSPLHRVTRYNKKKK